MLSILLEIRLIFPFHRMLNHSVANRSFHLMSNHLMNHMKDFRTRFIVRIWLIYWNQNHKFDCMNHIGNLWKFFLDIQYFYCIILRHCHKNHFNIYMLQWNLYFLDILKYHMRYIDFNQNYLKYFKYINYILTKKLPIAS